LNALSGFAHPDEPSRPDGTRLPKPVLDVMMPMHLLVSSTGHVRSVGPTLAKLWPESSLLGQRFLEVFEVKRPINIFNYADLLDHPHGLLRVRFREGNHMALRGMFASLDHIPGGGTARKVGDLLVNLSLGTNVTEAVQQFELTSADFAPSDPTVDMLYLMEAKSIALEESKRLNSRLEGARVVAEEQAFSDTLTGLQNRRGLDATLDRLIAAQTPFALMHLSEGPGGNRLAHHRPP